MEQWHQINENQPKIDLKTVQKSIQKSINKNDAKNHRKNDPPSRQWSDFGTHFGPSWSRVSRGGGSFFRTCSRKGLGGYPLTESGPILGRFWSVLGDLLGHQAVKIAIWGSMLMTVGCHLSILGHHFANLFSKVFLGTSLDTFFVPFFNDTFNTLDFCFSHLIFESDCNLASALWHTILETSA